jgi:hypothetical protein
MTVSTAINAITYLTDGATLAWSFPFPGVSTDFIEVSITDEFGTITNLANTQFSVSLNPAIDPNPTSQGGTVIFPLTGIPTPVGSQITISRVLPVVQNVSLSNQSIVYPPVIEEEFDYLTLLQQEQSTAFDRSFRVGPLDPPPLPVVPVAQRANQGAFFDSAGNLTPGSIPGPGVFISGVMIPVVEAATLALAQQNMGIPDLITQMLSLIYSTGDLKPTHKVVADPGWIFWVDGTIGTTGSGATIRTNPDTLPLFSLYYNSFTDALCPLTTSTGGATTRSAQGTSSAAFNNKCRVALPKGSSRALALAGHGAGLSARTVGAVTGVESVTQSVNQMPPHTHPWVNQFNNQQPLTNVDDVWAFNNFDFSGPNSITYTDIGVTGGGAPTNTMQPTTFVNIMVKL